MADDDALEIQRSMAQRYRAEKIAQERRIKNDIRPMIARSGWYRPEQDVPSEGTEYPKHVKVGDGKTTVIAHNIDEELAILGKQVTPPKAVSVNIEQLAQTQEPVRVKRKYTKRQPQVSAPLPEPLK